MGDRFIEFFKRYEVRENLWRLVLAALCVPFFLSTSFANVLELESRKVCTWDPVGANGPVMSSLSYIRPEAMRWGYDLQFTPYKNEREAAQDLQRGKCDIAVVTAIVSKDFVGFAGSLDAIGGIVSTKNLVDVLERSTSKKFSEAMVSGEYEVVGSLPVGALYACVRDRRVTSLSDMKGKRIGVLEGDLQFQTLAGLIGASPVRVDLATFARGFNSGLFDIVMMPAIAFNTFELYRGMEEKGGVLDQKMLYGFLQLVSSRKSFSDDFGLKMRSLMLRDVSNKLEQIKAAEDSIPKHYWIPTSDKLKLKLEDTLKDVRLILKVKDKLDIRALRFLWQRRCELYSGRKECELP